MTGPAKYVALIWAESADDMIDMDFFGTNKEKLTDAADDVMESARVAFNAPYPRGVWVIAPPGAKVRSGRVVFECLDSLEARHRKKLVRRGLPSSPKGDEQTKREDNQHDEKE